MGSPYWDAVEGIHNGPHPPGPSQNTVLAQMASMDSSNWTLELRLCEFGTDMFGDLQPLFDDRIEPNVFFEPDFFNASFERIGKTPKYLLTVWEEIGATRIPRLSMPVARESLGLPPVTVWRVASSPFAPLSTPLLHRENAELTIHRFAELMAGTGELLPNTLLFEDLDTSSIVYQQLSEAGTAEPSPISFHKQARSVLTRHESVEAYEQAAMSPKHRREMRRQLRKLGKLGEVEFETAESFWDLLVRFEEFLLIESLSWKGRRRTAIHDIRRTAAFARQAATDLARNSACTIHSLRVNGKAIASLILLRSGGTYYPWKIAFDEYFARYSPGSQLLFEVSKRLHETNGFERADSLASSNNTLTGKLWPERMETVSLLMGMGPVTGKELSQVHTRLARKHSIKETAKRLLGR